MEGEEKQDNGRLARAMSECMRKLEELTHSIQKLREKYGKAAEENARLKAANPGSNPNGTAGKKPKRPYSAKDALAFVNGKTPGDGETPESEESGGKKPRKKKVGPEERYAGLDQVNFYNYDLEELERKYGPD